MYVDLESDNQRKGPNATLNVDPEKLTQIQQGLEAEAERIQTWIRDNHRALSTVDAAGEDDCSRHMAGDLSKTGGDAIEAAQTYVERLQTAAVKLKESAKAYQLDEEHNATNFRQGIL
jgi:PE family protein